MAESDHSLDKDMSTLDQEGADMIIHEKNVLENIGIDPTTSHEVGMTEISKPLDMGEILPVQPAEETALTESNMPDIMEYLPSTTDDLEMLEGFGSNPFEETQPKNEPETSQSDAFEYFEVAFNISNGTSYLKNGRSLDLGGSSLGRTRSEKASLEASSHDVAPTTSREPNDFSLLESTYNTSPTQLDSPSYVSSLEGFDEIAAAESDRADHASPVERAVDTAEQHLRSSGNAPPIDRARPIDLDQFTLNLGPSSLSKPASQATREKAKALQARLAKQFPGKNAVKPASVPPSALSSNSAGEDAASYPSDIFSRHDASESAISVASGGIIPSEFGEGAVDIDPEQAEFGKVKAAYLLKKRAGTAGIEDDVEFIKAEAKEMARQRKAVADEQHEREPTVEAESESEALFVTPGAQTPASHAPSTSDDGNEKSTFFTNSGKGCKRKGDDSDTMAPPKKKQSRKPKAPTGRSSGAGKGERSLGEEEIIQTMRAMQGSSKKAVAMQAASKKTKKKNGRGPSHNISNIGSMMTGTTDVFRDAAAVAGHSNQPGFRANTTRKDFALRDLIAGVPQDEKPQAAGDKKFLDESLKCFDGQGSCKPSLDGSGWTLKGMKCTLKHYQVLGISFMRKRENREEHPRGGILADEMGLGKTIQMIANIINGKPKQGQPKTTLIVASPALISQWFSEITKFTMTRKESKKHGLARIIQHRAGYRQGGSEVDIRNAIMESDICLTTYGEINKSYPKADIPAEITTERGKSDWWKKHFEENKGVFHDMKFLRVVLDEAQAIKNHTSHSSMSCRALKSEYYWAISGTPLVNGISEMYPYLKFLRHPHTGSMRTFQANFCSLNDPTGTEKLGVFLRQIIIRRTHKDTLFGARLVDLPTPKQNVIYLEFNAVERTVYEIVKQRFIQRINTITRRHGIASQAQYSHIWNMLLRLRQICSHVLLIQDTMLDLMEREDFEKLEEITKEVEGHSEDNVKVLTHLGHILADHTAAAALARNAQETSVAGIDVDMVPGEFHSTNGSAPDLGRRHGRTYNFQKYLTSAAESNRMAAIVERSKCCSCRLLPDTPQITSCYHIYCKGCMRALQHEAARTGRESARCTECGQKFQSVKNLPSISAIQTDETEDDATSLGGSSTNGRGRKKKEELDWIGQQGGVLPSAKTLACKAQILAWLKEVPTCKIIVYTQFLPMIRIMAKVCQGEGWGHLKYSGAMSQSTREKSLQVFSSDPSKKVMLMSLKCGGLGLNIVAASRVLLLDPWWNDAVEQQAFCRVFRIGQTNETRLTRLCVKSSIDSAMFAVKERKTVEIDKIMEESKPATKSTHELLKLFGPVGDDEDGNPGFIFLDDYQNEDEDEVADRFYEREEGHSFLGDGRREGFMGNDM